MKREINLEDKNNINECFDTICAEVEALGFSVPAEITAKDMRDDEGFSFDNVSVSFYWGEDGQFATIEVEETAEEAEAEETEEEAEAETTHIVEVAIISKYCCKYAVVYYSDGTTVEAETVEAEVLDFINLMIARGCFEIVLNRSCSCVKFGGCYKDTSGLDIVSVSAELDVRADEHYMPFDKFEEGVWYHATGYCAMVDTHFSTEYVRVSA